jgi:DNA gyrase/topoisomerase IV subunit B
MEEKKYKESDIQSLEGMEHIRLRPQLYFEDCFKENNLNSLVFGSLCHAIDEYFDNNCNEIIVIAEEKSFNVKYNAGMSLEKSWDLTIAECIMTKIGACSNEKNILK